MARSMTRVVAIILAWSFILGVLPAGADVFEEAPWTLSLGGGHIGREGDEPVKDGQFLSIKVGYDLSPRWTLEWDLALMPHLRKRTFNYDKFELDDDTWGLRTGMDVLLHLRTTKNLRFDPYLAAGVGMAMYGKSVGPGGTSIGSGSIEASVPVGVGVMYHFNDSWAARADWRHEFHGMETARIASEHHTILSAGVTYRFGASVPPAYTVAGAGDLDSDGDGLYDWEEIQLGTDPFNPDTDGDGLTDYEEVRIYKTDPLNPDTDYDGLTDGAEVHVYRTDPLNPDTDGGGVADGHEVIEDGTDPLDPSDDLQLFTLNIEFDYDKAVLRPHYFDQLDVVVKVLDRDPGATARVEGHADKRPKSKHAYNMRLSERRARAVVDYLVDVGGMARTRLTPVGYGFTRPVAPNDTEENMQRNRRTEIYIRPSHQQPGAAGQPADRGVGQPEEDVHDIK